MKSPLAMIGHNKPPSPFEEVETEINGLYEEAGHWLDGAEVDSKESANGIATLLNMLRLAGKDADALHKEEKAPHLKESKAVDDKYRPMRDKAKQAGGACKSALEPWLEKEKAALRAEAEEKRLLAEKAKAEAEAAIQATGPDNLKERAAAEEKVDLAKKLDIDAKSVENAKPNIKNAAGKAIGLKTFYVPEITDAVEAIRHYWPNDEINAVLIKLAERDVRAGKREIPGFVIHEKKQAV